MTLKESLLKEKEWNRENHFTLTGIYDLMGIDTVAKKWITLEHDVTIDQLLKNSKYLNMESLGQPDGIYHRIEILLK